MTTYGETQDHHAVGNVEHAKMTARMATSSLLRTQSTLQVSGSLIRFLCPIEQAVTDSARPTTGVLATRKHCYDPRSREYGCLLATTPTPRCRMNLRKTIGTTAVLATLGVLGDGMLLSARES